MRANIQVPLVRYVRIWANTDIPPRYRETVVTRPYKFYLILIVAKDSFATANARVKLAVAHRLFRSLDNVDIVLMKKAASQIWRTGEGGLKGDLLAAFECNARANAKAKDIFKTQSEVDTDVDSDAGAQCVSGTELTCVVTVTCAAV